ncbi:putative alpha/beta fold family hydrolase [Neohortaea acidophila]|uniref:Putative alpha/beta fold family hydrolase n=1 Tax=Neohortaea acidophila TaxID=245834 RepID=A0A6A6PKX0_9PEZI|nr:putative alpha/beta fold family hydrolase [Neohortaea acidophila]KAF2480662.1 putative alpha/beta fold family hydrolase [Neohortaea acidophila]
MPYITHKNGQKTYYIDEDFANPWEPHETILIQHGFARHSAFWYTWVPVLAKQFRVIRRDARGHGYSSVPGQDYQYKIDTILDEIVDTLDQLGLKKVHYLGESTGGIWGEFLAARNPERLHSLTICSSPLYMPSAAQDMLAFGHQSWPVACRQLGSRGWGEALIGVVGADQMPDKEFLGWWLNQIAVANGDGLGDHAELLCDPAFDARRIMHDIKVPMLMLTPAGSKLVDLDEQKQLKEAVPGCRMEVIKGFGHEIYIDQAEQCQEKFLAFLKALSS